MGEASDRVERTYDDSFGGSEGLFRLWCRTASLGRNHGKLKQFLRHGEQDHETETPGDNPPKDFGDGWDVWVKTLNWKVWRSFRLTTSNTSWHMVTSDESGRWISLNWRIGQMDASELHARRLNAKEVLPPMKGDNFVFPVADGTVKVSGGDQRLKPSTLIWDRPERGEEKDVLGGKLEELSFPTPLQDDSTRDDEEAERGGFIYRHHVEPRVKLHMPKEETFPIPLKYIDITRNTHTSLDVLLERMEKENYQMHGQASQDWFIVLNNRPLDGYTWSGETDEETNDLKTQQCMARCVEAYVWCSDEESKTKMGCRETKTRQCQTIERNILHWAKRWRIQAQNQSRSSKVGSSNALQKTDPCLISGRGETCRRKGKHKTKYACIVETDESMRIRLEGVPWRYHEDHISAKGINSLCRYNLVHNFIAMPQAY